MHLERRGMKATDDPGGHRKAAELHAESANLHETHAIEMREKGRPESAGRAERIADRERELADRERDRADKHRHGKPGE
jgi:hypothetical protein